MDDTTTPEGTCLMCSSLVDLRESSVCSEECRENLYAKLMKEKVAEEVRRAAHNVRAHKFRCDQLTKKYGPLSWCGKCIRTKKRLDNAVEAWTAMFGTENPYTFLTAIQDQEAPGE